jgi:hypothetical protein
MLIILMQRLVRYLRLRNLLQHFLCANSDMYALQLRYLGSDAVDDCESGGKYCCGSCTAGTRR